MSKNQQNQLVKDAQKVYARISRILGYQLDLDDPGDFRTLCDHAGDDEDLLRRAREICREEGISFSGRSREYGYGADSWGSEDDDTEDCDTESWDENDEDELS
jgi:hypothetical protein